MNRLSLSVELKRGVVRQQLIRRQLCGYEERVDWIGIGIGSWREDGIQTMSHVYNPTGFSVIGQLQFNPHCHILLADGGFYGKDMSRVAPRPENKPIEDVFRHKVFEGS